MDLKFNFIVDCVKLFLFNDKSFKNIQKENVLTSILWLVVPLVIISSLVGLVIGLFSGATSGIMGFLAGLMMSIMLIIAAGFYSVIIYGITHLILVGFGSKVKFKENFKLQLSTYSFGLTAWVLPIIILGILIFTIFPFDEFMILSGGLLILLLITLFIVYIWYFVVLVHYLSKQNKISKGKTFFSVIIVSIISIVLSLGIELMGF
jgi:hypothetical protein